MLAPPAAFAQAAAQTEAAPEKATPKQARKARAAQPARSLEARHEVCLAFLRRHGYTCDTWVEPTCGADSGYYRPEECQRPHHN